MKLAYLREVVNLCEEIFWGFGDVFSIVEDTAEPPAFGSIMGYCRGKHESLVKGICAPSFISFPSLSSEGCRKLKGERMNEYLMNLVSRRDARQRKMERV